MDRLKKLIGMILILGIVFFIICDEKGVKIEFQGGRLLFHETKKVESLTKEKITSTNVVYKNSGLIHINHAFEDPWEMRRGVGIYNGSFSEQLGLTDKERETKEEPIILYKNSNKIKIYSGFEKPQEMRRSIGVYEEYLNENTELSEEKTEIKEKPIILYKNSNKIRIYSGFEDPREMRRSIGVYNEPPSEQSDLMENEIETEETLNEYQEYQGELDYEENTEGAETGNGDFQYIEESEIDEIEFGDITENEGSLITTDDIENEIKKYEYKPHKITIRRAIVEDTVLDINNFLQEEKEVDIIDTGNPNLDGGKTEIIPVRVEKYKLKTHPLKLRKGVMIKHNFSVESTQSIETELSDSALEDLLENEEIDINTLDSENDEFLQEVFEKTKDISVMNLIVETYLNEYQFTKAKKFIENLPDSYSNQLKPLLNLRVAFNSFSLGSSTVYDNLELMVQNYSSSDGISDEDTNRYLGVLALMKRDYDKFFEIAKDFGSEKNKTFVLKLQGYKDQIAKQMGMPDYYFDTLVSLELFNQGLFQPAKVLALSSLQKNINYILPYQVLAYANFLTNSRDTSIEYMKKLIDLDPNNAEKYRFLMGIAFYRDEKYEQSVVMLSMIKDDKLRLDAQRYLINNYLKLDQKNKLISSRNKLLGYENLVASDFYTYFYETFFHPYSEGKEFQLYAFDTELANKMLRVCSITLQDKEKAVCTYGTIGRNIALGQFDGIEKYLLDLVEEYPQGYLYQALGDYYIQQGNLDKAKVYLLKAVSLTQKTSERSQIKKLLEDTM